MNKLMSVGRGYESFTIWLAKLLMVISAASLFTMMMLIALEVILRYFFRTSLHWPFEVVEFIMVGITFLGLAYVQLRDRHLKVEYVFEHLKPSVQVIARIITILVTLFLFVLVTKSGWDYTWMAWTEKLKSWTLARMIIWPVRLTVALGGFAMCLYLLVELYHSVIALKKKEPLEEEIEREVTVV